MRILIDTNVLISATLNANSNPYYAYEKATSYPNHRKQEAKVNQHVS